MVAPLVIGNVVVDPPILQAPMAGFTNAAFREVGFDGVYLPLRIPADSLQESLKEFEKLDISGYSVTIPHKEGVMEKADDVGERLGIVNVPLRGPVVQVFLMPDQPPHVLRVDGAEAEANGDALRHVCSGLFLVATANPSEGVKQHGEEEGQPTRRLYRESRCERTNSAFAARETLQMLEGLERVDIGRVDVEHVVVHAADERIEFGDHRGDEPRFVELPDRGAAPQL